MSTLILAALTSLVIVQAHDFASDIETCKHVSASLGSYVILEAKPIESMGF